MYFRWNSFDDLFSKRNSCPVQIFFLLQVTIVKSSSVSEPHPLFVECNTGDKNPCLPILCKRRKRILFDIRTGTADIGEKYLTVIRKAAGDYTKEIFHKLREREYNPELMRLYVVGGGGCMIQNFGEYDKGRVTIVRDICATAKGYEAMTVRKIQRNGGMLV